MDEDEYEAYLDLIESNLDDWPWRGLPQDQLHDEAGPVEGCYRTPPLEGS